MKRRSVRKNTPTPRRTLMDFPPKEPPRCAPGRSVGDPVRLLRDFLQWGFDPATGSSGWHAIAKADETGTYAGQRGAIEDRSIVKLEHVTAYMVEGIDFEFVGDNT